MGRFDRPSLVRFGRFIAGGAANTALTYALYYVLHLCMPYQIAYLCAYIAGIGFSYIINATMVFKVPMTWRGFFSFPLVYIVQYFFSALLLEVLVKRFDIGVAVAPLVVTIFAIPLTFVMTRFVLRAN